LLASLPKEEFEDYLGSANRVAVELSTAGALRLARRRRGNPHRARKRRSRRAVTMLGDVVAESAPGAIVNELENHRQLLADVLRPIYKGTMAGDIHFERGERRVVGDLLVEMDRLLVQLKGLCFHCAVRMNRGTKCHEQDIDGNVLRVRRKVD
jgi:hypothetical protein